MPLLAAPTAWLDGLTIRLDGLSARLAAWRGALQMMWDHPFGVGWNRAVEVYAKDYSPPEGGAAIITTNEYLMLGTQLGGPGLICFVSYVGQCFKSPRFKIQSWFGRS